MNVVTVLVFILDVAISFILLLGSMWSIAFPGRRIWPPPGRQSWQYRLAWTCFYLAFTLNAALFILDWDTWILTDGTRLILGIPLGVIGVTLLSWGIATLGIGNTSGLQRGFTTAGPYRFTRNPQYLGDMMLFMGLSLVANSTYLWITHALLILVFILTPLAEETWLEEEYGEEYLEEYLEYKRNTARFL